MLSRCVFICEITAEMRKISLILFIQPIQQRESINGLVLSLKEMLPAYNICFLASLRLCTPGTTPAKKPLDHPLVTSCTLFIFINQCTPPSSKMAESPSRPEHGKTLWWGFFIKEQEEKYTGQTKVSSSQA